MKRWHLLPIILAVMLFSFGCSTLCNVIPGGCPAPTPTPTPAPTPTPTPTPTPPPPDPHVPKCNTVPEKCDCWTKGPATGNEWKWIECAVTDPGFDFEACEANYQSGVCLVGEPELGIYFYNERTVDFTPKLKGLDRCAHYGFAPRVSCPTVQDPDPRRGPSEKELMGGDVPNVELVVTSGSVTVSRPGGWFARLHGTGTGKIRGCYPNGKACSKWLDFDV